MKLELTNQQIYDTVVTHLWTQNEVSRNDDSSSCAYYDEATGNKCAVGCLIPAELYSWELEGRGVRNLKFSPDSACRKVAKFLGVTVSNTKTFLLVRLQEFHDGVFRPLPATDSELLKMLTDLTDIAEDLGLSTKILTTTFCTNRPGPTGMTHQTNQSN